MSANFGSFKREMEAARLTISEVSRELQLTRRTVVMLVGGTMSPRQFHLYALRWLIELRRRDREAAEIELVRKAREEFDALVELRRGSVER
jgi:hypothetical protein